MGTRSRPGQVPAGITTEGPLPPSGAVPGAPLLWPYQSRGTIAADDGSAVHPFDPRTYLHERYVEKRRRSCALRAYYALRPLVPRRLQLALRRAYVPLQRTSKFPAWPIEPVLVEGQYEHLRNRLAQTGESQIPFVNFWPDGKRFCAVLTHDVESEEGIEAIPRLLEIEQRLGFRSSWNFCAEQYAIPPDLFGTLRTAGCEVGLHGILHDGKLFASRSSFESNLPRIHRYLSEWQADGFRSPATHRRAAWMPELGSAYDSSFPDTDPFEPIPGGCCSIFPFFIDGMVELPITLVQDHTCFEILGERSISAWILKSEWIIHHHGLINLIVHPDYMLTAERLALYEEFLRFLKEQGGGWHALPREVAQWWKKRSAIDADTVERGGGEAGEDVLAPSPTLAFASEEAGKIAFDIRRPKARRRRFVSEAEPATRPNARSSR